MLTPDNRATFLDQLRPGVGRRLEHLVGTTFTLDLESALLPPLAFAEYGDSRDPLSMLAAVHTSIEKVDLFYQCGQVRVPSNPSALMEFLQPSLHAVRPPQGGLFHPKIWLARYVDDDDEASTYRLLVQSRNLTPDASWDLVAAFDGWQDTRRDKANTPLSDLLRYLASDSTTVAPIRSDRATRLRDLADAIRYAQWELPDGAKALGFHAIGLPGRKTAPPDFSGTRQLIIAPFLTDEGLDLVRSSECRRLVVVSRQEAFDQLSPEWAGDIDEAYILDPAAGIPDPDDSGSVLSGLHAKAFVVEFANQTRLFLGSANATGPAFSRNIEVLVEMVVSGKALGIDALLGDEGMAPILLPYDPEGGGAPDAEDEADRILANVVRALASTLVTATITPAADQFDLHLTTERPLKARVGFSIAVGLTSRPGNVLRTEPGLCLDHRVRSLPLVDITPYVTITVTSPEGRSRGTVVVATLIGDPPGRLDELIAAQLTSPEDFLRMITLLLSMHDVDAAAAGSLRSAWGGVGSATFGSGLLELLLQALANRSGDLEAIDRIVKRLDTDHGRPGVLPDGFSELWTVVRQAADVLEGEAQ